MVDLTPLFTCKELKTIAFKGNWTLTLIGFVTLEVDKLVDKQWSSDVVDLQIPARKLINDSITVNRSVLYHCRIQFYIWKDVDFARVEYRGQGMRSVSYVSRTRDGPCVICKTNQPKYGKVVCFGKKTWLCASCLVKHFIPVFGDGELNLEVVDSVSLAAELSGSKNLSDL